MRNEIDLGIAYAPLKERIARNIVHITLALLTACSSVGQGKNTEQQASNNQLPLSTIQEFPTATLFSDSSYTSTEESITTEIALPTPDETPVIPTHDTDQTPEELVETSAPKLISDSDDPISGIEKKFIDITQYQSLDRVDVAENAGNLSQTAVSIPKEISQKEVILPVPIDSQDLSLSCEASASAMVAAYINPDPPKGFDNWERYFIETVPLNCNPHKGFRGKIDGYLSTSCEPPNGYGVYAEPLQEAFNKAGIITAVEYGVDYDRISQIIREGHPVIVWISGKSAKPNYEIDPETGQKYPLVLGEHAWVIIGVSVDNSRFLVNDPLGGSQFWIKRFPRWEEFEGMRLIVLGKKTERKVSKDIPKV